MKTSVSKTVCTIIPPHILQKMLDSSNAEVREAAMGTLLTTARLRGERSVRGQMGLAAATQGAGRRTIFDCQKRRSLGLATVARTEQGPAAADTSVNRAFDGLGTTRQFYQKVFGRNSIDGAGMRLNGYVHFSRRYNNAFWDGSQMVFGDGDGVNFTDFTKSLDVIGHELTHGVTEHTAGLEYHNQSGALNESISDVFGSLVKQWSLQQKADQADWLIGKEIFTPGIGADALRSMKAPGTAYDNAAFGKDPQPDHMSKYVTLSDDEEGDNGGVHINSGIPNKAFYLTAIGIGGFAWEAPGHIWYEALKASNPQTDFQAFADTTYAKAGQLYGAGSDAQHAVHAAWKEVGLRVGGSSAAPHSSASETSQAGSDSCAELARKLEELARQVGELARGVAQHCGDR